MSTALLISIILNGLFIFAIVWMVFELSMSNIAGKYQKDLADIYKDRVESLNERYEEMSRIATDAIENNNHTLDVAKHTQYKLEHAVKVVNYAANFLKPRKRNEMYHILNDFKRFDEWKKQQEELKEMQELKDKLDNN